MIKEKNRGSWNDGKTPAERIQGVHSTLTRRSSASIFISLANQKAYCFNHVFWIYPQGQGAEWVNNNHVIKINEHLEAYQQTPLLHMKSDTKAVTSNFCGDGTSACVERKVG